MKFKQLKFFICLILVVVNLVVFGQVITHDFVTLDDSSYVVENPNVRSGLTRQGFIWAFETRYHRHWHPLTWLSHMADCQVFGLNPAGHHSVNLLIHIINTLLLFFIFLKMTDAIYPSALVAVLFAIHPLHVETVAWVADRKDLLCGLFWFLTILAYIGYCARSKAAKFIPVFIFMAIGVLCKSSIMTLPFALLLLDYWPLRRLGWGQMAPEANVRFGGPPFLKVAVEKIPLFLLTAGAIIGAYITKNAYIEAPVDRGNLLPSLSTASQAICTYTAYLVKALWPRNLAAPYPHPKFAPCDEWKIAIAIILLVAISAISLWQFRKRPFLIVGWLFFLGNILPVVGFLNIGPVKMADRYTYISLIGLFVMVVFYLDEQIKRHRRPKIAVAVGSTAAVLVLMISSFLQTRHWENSISLFSHALKVTANNELAHNNLGIEYMNAGDIQNARDQFRKALEIRPAYLNALVNTGVLLQREGRLGEAQIVYIQAIKNRPDYAPAHYNLGRAFEQLGNTDQAAYHYRQAVNYQPEYHQALNNLGVIMARRGRYDEAVKYFQKSLKILPESVQALNNLGGVLQKTGKTKEAERNYRKAINLEPDNEAALFNLAGILEIKGEIIQAVGIYRRILKANPGSAEAYLGLGRVAEGQGEMHQALEYYQRVINLKPDFYPAHKNRKRVLGKVNREPPTSK